MLQYKSSSDAKVARAGMEVCSGRKWKAFRKLQVAEERLRERSILGAIAKGRAGLGVFPTIRVDKTTRKEKRRPIQDEVHKGEYEID